MVASVVTPASRDALRSSGWDGAGPGSIDTSETVDGDSGTPGTDITLADHDEDAVRFQGNAEEPKASKRGRATGIWPGSLITLALRDDSWKYACTL